MLTLIILACLADDCTLTPVAAGFVHEKQCIAFAPLMIAGWKAGHPGVEVRRFLCSPNPEFVLNRGKA